MKKRLAFRSRTILLAAASILFAAAIAMAADAITTLENLRVEGEIVSETDSELILNTEKYGVLHFKKMNLKTIERGIRTTPSTTPKPPTGNAPTRDPFSLDSSPDPFGAGSVDPFGGGSSGTTTDPFGEDTWNPGEGSVDPFGGGSSGSPDPFGGASSGSSGGGAFSGFRGLAIKLDMITLLPPPAASAPPPSPPPGASPPAGATYDPFGPTSSNGATYDPFALPGTRNSSDFGNMPGPNDVASASLSRDGLPAGRQDSELGAAVPALPPRTAPPIVEAGFDAVLFGISATLPVEIKTPESQWGAAAADTQLKTGSEVRTNETPSSRLLLRDKKDELRLPKQSHIEIERLSDDSEEVVITLRAGSVWSEVTPRGTPDAFMIKTPELTAGVRGTNFRVDRMAGASRVSVFEGTVHVTAIRTGAFVTLNANQTAVVNLQGQILDLIATPVDEQEIFRSWEDWAYEASFGTGASAAGFTPISSLSQQIANDNAQWESTMQEYMRNVAEVKYMDKLDEYASAFLRFAGDTGHIPTDEEGWSVLKFDTGTAGWNGPYIEGPIPPLDPWKRPLVYKKLESQTGRVFGRVYSLWQDGRDQGGVNSSVDKAAIISYYSLDRFRDDPNVNPPE